MSQLRNSSISLLSFHSGLFTRTPGIDTGSPVPLTFNTNGCCAATRCSTGANPLM